MGGASLLAAGFCSSTFGQGDKKDLRGLEVASDGSIRAMLEGPLRTSAASSLELDLRTRAGGADAVAGSLVDGSLHADVFIPITAGPMLTVLHAGLASMAVPIASTELVLFYSPKSRFAPQFAAVAQGGAPWWKVLQQPGLRLRRSDPASDPSGRAILFALMLAAEKYNSPHLVEAVLGPALNPTQIVPGGSNQERLRNGEFDVLAAYRIGAGPAGLPYLALTDDLNFSDPHVQSKHPGLQLSFGEKTFYPEPLVFYAAVLDHAANPAGAAAFVQWLQGPQAQALLRQAGFRPAGEAVSLGVNKGS